MNSVSKKSLPRILLLLIPIELYLLHQWFEWKAFARENGILENLQVTCYFMAFLIAVITCVRLHGFGRWLASVFAVAVLTLFFREIDVDAIPLSGPFDWLNLEAVKNSLLAGGFAFLAFRLAYAYSSEWRQLLKIPLRTAPAFAIIGCLFLVLGRGFEQHQLTVWEELVELEGAFFILLSTWLYMKDPEQLIS